MLKDKKDLENLSASELTPGILTPIVKSGGGSAITGSVEFDGTGDYLSVQSQNSTSQVALRAINIAIN